MHVHNIIVCVCVRHTGRARECVHASCLYKSRNFSNNHDDVIRLNFKIVGERLKPLRQGSALFGQPTYIPLWVVFRTSWNWCGTHNYELTETNLTIKTT